MSRDGVLGTDGPVFGFLDKVGTLIALSVVWFLGCLPVVTVAASTTALYYAVSKSVRREYGSAMQEFWHSYRANLKRGIPITVILAMLTGLLVYNIQLMTRAEGDSNLLLWGSILLLAALAGITVYICPVLSRFSMSAWNACRLAFVMAVRFWYFTLALALGTAALVLLQCFVLPIPTALLLPAVWCLAVTYPVEKVLLAYMPPKEDNDDSWYYQ